MRIGRRSPSPTYLELREREGLPKALPRAIEEREQSTVPRQLARARRVGLVVGEPPLGLEHLRVQSPDIF